MAEIKTEVKVYKIDYVCDECKDGFLLPTGVMLPTCPAQYPHKCSNSLCNRQITFRNQYPRIVYDDVL